MFGLTEITELLVSSNDTYQSYQMGIVPTILLPLAFLSTGISIVATFIASLFGVKLKAEGPKKLLEILLRPRVLISALILNAIIYGGFHLYGYIKNGPVPKVIVSFKNKEIDYSKLAISTENGWTQNLTEGIFAKGAIFEDKLYVGSIEGNLFALDIETGKIEKKVYFGKFLSPTPTLFMDHLYFGEGLHESHNMHIYKLNPKDMTVSNSFQTKGHTEIFPTFAEIDNTNILLQSAGGDGLYAINPETMKPIWHFQDGHMDAFALVHNRDIYIASGIPEEDIGLKRPYAYKLDGLTGKLIWKKELPISSWYGPVLVNNQICFIQGEIHVKSNVGGLVCFFEDGERSNSLTIDNPIISKPLTKNEIVYFNDYFGNLYAWDSLKNKILWKKLFGQKKPSYSSVNWFDNRTLVHVLSNGKILFVNIESADIVHEEKFPSNEPLYADPLVHGNDIIIFGMKGEIFKKNIKL